MSKSATDIDITLAATILLISPGGHLVCGHYLLLAS